MLPSLSQLVIQSIDAKGKADGTVVEDGSLRDDGDDGDVVDSGDDGDDAPTIDCGEVERMIVFRANVFKLNPQEARWVAGGRMQMPGMALKDEVCSIMCSNMKINLKMATLETRLAYSNEQFLFHAGTDSTLKDDGHFRYFAFDASHSANYALEESVRRNAKKEFMHVFRVKKDIPNLAFFADSETWAQMSGRTSMLENGTCPPELGTLDAKTTESRTKAANALGMPLPEYNWSERIRDFKTSTGEELNGFIGTTILSAMEPDFIVAAKFELMLNVHRLSDYLEHVKCYVLEDYVGQVVYQKD